MPDADANTIIDLYSRAVRHADARGYSLAYADTYGVAHVARYLDTHGLANDDAAANGYDDAVSDLDAGRDLDPDGHRVIHTDSIANEHADAEPDSDEHGGPDFDTNADSRAYDDQRYADADAAAHHHAEEYAGPSD